MEFITITTLSNEKFTNEQTAYLHLAFWAICLSNLKNS